MQRWTPGSPKGGGHYRSSGALSGQPHQHSPDCGGLRGTSGADRDPQLISQGATRKTKKPVELAIADYASQVIIATGLVKNGFSYQAAAVESPWRWPGI